MPRDTLPLAVMHRTLSRNGEGTVGLEVRGRVTEDELESMLESVESAIAEHGSVNLLVHMPSAPYPDLDTLDEDLGFWLEHGEDIDRYAVVGDSLLLEWVTAVGDAVASPECAYFPEDGLDEAWEWARAG